MFENAFMEICYYPGFYSSLTDQMGLNGGLFPKRSEIMILMVNLIKFHLINFNIIDFINDIMKLCFVSNSLFLTSKVIHNLCLTGKVSHIPASYLAGIPHPWVWPKGSHMSRWPNKMCHIPISLMISVYNSSTKSYTSQCLT